MKKLLISVSAPCRGKHTGGGRLFRLDRGQTPGLIRMKSKSGRMAKTGPALIFIAAMLAIMPFPVFPEEADPAGCQAPFKEFVCGN